MINETLYTTDDLARMFQVGKTTIKRWADEGKLQCFKTPGGHRKFKPSSVHAFIKEYHYYIITPLLPFARTQEQLGVDAVELSDNEEDAQRLLHHRPESMDTFSVLAQPESNTNQKEK